MKNIGLIIKKELDKIFRFPRMIFSTLILPGLIIFVVYGLMGSSFTNLQKNVDEHKSYIYVVNYSEQVKPYINQINNVNIVEAQEAELENLKAQIESKEIDALIVFDKDFDNKIDNNQKPNIDLFYSYVNSYSSEAYQKIYGQLEAFKNNLLVSKYGDIELYTVGSNKVNKENEEAGYMLSMILPMLIMIMIFANALGIGADAIAGEKERGTLSTILMTPIKRSEFVTGKLLSTVVLTFLAATSSFVGILLSLPLNSEFMGVGDVGNLSYEFIDYMYLFVTLIVIALFASLLLLIASTCAKTTKEATSYGLPVYFLAIICSVIPMFSNNDESVIYYFIPIYNASLMLRNIFSLSVNVTNFISMIASSLVLIGIAIVILQRIFKKESILFGN